jgi:hypothetical protein
MNEQWTRCAFTKELCRKPKLLRYGYTGYYRHTHRLAAAWNFEEGAGTQAADIKGISPLHFMARQPGKL